MSRTNRPAIPTRSPAGLGGNATTRRRACAPEAPTDPFQWGFPRTTSRANFRAAMDRYAA